MDEGGPLIGWLRVPEPSELPEELKALLRVAEEKLGFVPNVLRALALRPDHLLAWWRYYDPLMRGEGKLSRAEREMIALVVSRLNDCEYCLASHSSYLRELTGDPTLPDRIVANWRRVEELSERERALLAFAEAVTLDSARLELEDIEALRSVGLDDEAIFEAAEVAAMFNYTNRLLNALGVKPNREYYFRGR